MEDAGGGVGEDVNFEFRILNFEIINALSALGGADGFGHRFGGEIDVVAWLGCGDGGVAFGGLKEHAVIDVCHAGVAAGVVDRKTAGGVSGEGDGAGLRGEVEVLLPSDMLRQAFGAARLRKNGVDIFSYESLAASAGRGQDCVAEGGTRIDHAGNI